MPLPYDFSNKTALITGGKRGIGSAIAHNLARAGAICIVNDLPPDPTSPLPPGSIFLPADVGDDSQVAGMMEQIRGRFGGLDILINNAGILRDRTLAKMTHEEWDSVLRVNLSGAFHCIQRATPILRPGGRVVSLCSVSGQLGLFGQANYAAAKAGLLALTKVAARELARQQITANAVAPGFIDTEMTRGIPPETAQKFLEQTPLSRMGTVDEVAAAVLFLCCAEAGYITGQVINVNGGFYMP